MKKSKLSYIVSDEMMSSPKNIKKWKDPYSVQVRKGYRFILNMKVRDEKNIYCLEKWGMLISYLLRITSDKKIPE